MPIAKSFPVRFSYRGLSDAYDSTDAFLGACRSLANFVFDRSNPELIVPRPGVTPITSFAGFATPGFISIHNTIAPRVYGMLGTARNAGKDEPFCYDLAAAAFVAISGVQATNVPTSPASSGSWVPPTFTIVGTRLVFTHPGFAGAGGNYFGLIDISGTNIAPTGTTAIGSFIVTAVSSIVGVEVGQRIANAGIPANSTVASFTAATITFTNPTATPATANAVATVLAITGGTKAAPLWGAGQTTGNALPTAPSAVANFNNRAYYAIGNTLYFSDNLRPTHITNATQTQVVGDDASIIALFGAPVQTSSGGVTAALFIFKDGGQIWQLVGDSATNNLLLSPVSLDIGTSAPRSLALAPEGVYFAGNDAPYFVNVNGVVSALSHDASKILASDVSAPFRFATQPSRMAACFNSQTYRVCLDTVILGQAISGADYWFDLRKRRWNGIHTFAYDCASPYMNYFILSTANTPGVLFKSQSYSDTASTYADNGTAYQCTAISATWAKIEDMSQKQVIETTTELAYITTPSLSYSVTALDEQGNSLGSAAVNAYRPGSLWGGFTWGSGLWSSTIGIPHTFDVPWPAPIVTQKIAIQHSIPAVAGAAVGSTYMRYQKTGYTVAPPPAS